MTQRASDLLFAAVIAATLLAGAFALVVAAHRFPAEQRWAVEHGVYAPVPSEGR